MNELVIVWHLRVAYDGFVTVIFFVDHPDVRRPGYVLGAGDNCEKHTCEEAESFRRHREAIHRI
jgi:hypothetical protein